MNDLQDSSKKGWFDWINTDEKADRKSNIIWRYASVLSVAWSIIVAILNLWRGNPQNTQGKNIENKLVNIENKLAEQIKEESNRAKEEANKRVEEVEKRMEEAERRIRAEERTKNAEEKTEMFENLNKENKEEKIKFFNQSEQRREIISWHDFTEEEKEILDQEVSSVEWEKEEIVKAKRDEVRFKQHKCKSCSNCNS